MNNHVTVLEIDGKALGHNLNYLKKKLQPTTKILAVIKAFSYGSDDVLVAKFLEIRLIISLLHMRMKELPCVKQIFKSQFWFYTLKMRIYNQL